MIKYINVIIHHKRFSMSSGMVFVTNFLVKLSTRLLVDIEKGGKMPTYKLVNPRFNHGSIILVCDCIGNEHQITFTWYPNEKEWSDLGLDYMEGFVSIQTHLVTHRNFFERLWYAIKYVFGYKSRYGAFDELLAYRDDVENLVEFLKEFLDASKEK